MTRKINLNADMGEGFGAYDIGNDEGLMQIIKSANIACGFHAGDPDVMAKNVMAAKARGVSIGAHPGFNDLWGFGRRNIDMSLSALEHAVTYQIGALQAIAAYADLKVTHLKAHGALSNMAAIDKDMALAIGRAIKTVDPDIIYVVLAGSQLESAAKELGLDFAREGFADRQYDDDGNLASRKLEGTVFKDPEIALKQVLRMVEHGEIVSRNGKIIQCQVDTICVHGDEPTSLGVARYVRDGLEEAGVEVVALTEMNFSREN